MMSALHDTDEYADQAFTLLCELCEQQPPILDGAVLADHFLQPARLLIDLGALRATDAATAVICRACGQKHATEIEFDDLTGIYWQYCLDSGWVEVPAADLKRCELNLEWLVDQLSVALNIGSRPKCLIDGMLWDLGEAQAGVRSWTALFSRRLSIDSELDRVLDALATRAGKQPGLVFTTTEAFSSRIPIPGGHRLLPLSNCARIDANGFAIDYAVLLAAVDRTGAGRRSRTGMPGRPTAKHLYIAEHQRRINSSEAEYALADEARYLHCWMQEQYPEEPRGSVGTIENNIRKAHQQWQAMHPRN